MAVCVCSVLLHGQQHPCGPTTRRSSNENRGGGGGSAPFHIAYINRKTKYLGKGDVRLLSCNANLGGQPHDVGVCMSVLAFIVRPYAQHRSTAGMLI